MIIFRNTPLAQGTQLKYRIYHYRIHYIGLSPPCLLSGNTVRHTHTHIPTDSKHYHILGRMADCCRPSPHSGPPETQYGCKSVRATRRRVESPPSASGIRRYGRSRKGGASMPGRERCPMQTGRGLCMRGDQRGRGTQLEYDRKGKLLYIRFFQVSQFSENSFKTRA